MNDEIPNNSLRVNEAFSAQAPKFDTIQRTNPMLEWMRSIVHRHMAEFIRPGQSLIDINAGTGIDAVHFAQAGLTVHAMDIAEGMVNEIWKKIELHSLHHSVTAEQRSFSEAGQLAPKTFDHCFSNFGGLNCVPDLRPIADQLRRIVRPGGMVTVVVMPRICPWELLHLLRGNTQIGLRRLRKQGVIAHIEGHYFRTYYHSVSDVLQSFGSDFTIVAIRGVASFSPPPFMEKFPGRYPGLYRFLQRCDERFNISRPFNRWADQFIITMKFQPS
jgi:ubiquinone/menaquinone biosynthesis C-methylase UbiE